MYISLPRVFDGVLSITLGQRGGSDGLPPYRRYLLGAFEGPKEEMLVSTRLESLVL